MVDRTRRVGRMLVLAATAALVLTALPGSIAAAAAGRDCVVRDLSGGGTSTSLQAAVTGAEGGSELAIRGTCIGPSLIDRDLGLIGIRQRGSGVPTIRSGSAHPSLVVDPVVSDLTFADGLVIRGGIVVDEIADWDPSGSATSIWPGERVMPIPPPAGKPKACRVVNTDTGQRYGKLRRAVWKASAGDHLVMQGRCRGPVFIAKDLSIRGVRAATSSMQCDRSGCSTTGAIDTGPPTIRSTGVHPAVIVAPGVSDLVLKHITIKGGLSVGDTEPYREFLASR